MAIQIQEPVPDSPALPVNFTATASPQAARATKLASEQVIVQAPMSYTGSARRIWRIGGALQPEAARIALVVLLLIPMILLTWGVVTLWYLFFGIWLVPYRLIRKGARKNKRDQLRHRETLDAINRK
jgi:hypothetical protein